VFTATVLSGGVRAPSPLPVLIPGRIDSPFVVAAVTSARLTVAAIDLVAESCCLPISPVAGTTGGRSAARAVRALPPTFAAAAVAAAAAVVSSIRLPHAEAGSVVDAAGVMGLVAVPCMYTALAPAAVATLVAIVHSGVAGGSAVAGSIFSPCRA
jgi:hypothetical protein